MSRLRYEDDPELVKAVSFCMDNHFSADEAVSYLTKNGFNVTKDTYRRIKRRLLSIRREKIKNLQSGGRDQYLIDSLTILIKIRDKVMDMTDNTEDFWKKLKGYEFVANLINNISKYYDADPDSTMRQNHDEK